MRILKKDSSELNGLKDLPYVFHQAFSSYSLANKQCHVILTNDHCNIFLPALITPTKFLKVLTILYPPLSLNGRIDKNEEKVFFEELILFLKKEGICDRITNPMLLDVFHASPEKSKTTDFGNISISLLENSEEEIFKKFRKNYRYEINRCSRENVTMKFGADQFNAFYALYESTMLRQHLFLEKKEALQILFTELDKSNAVICGVVYHNEIPQGAVFIPFTKYASYYLYGGSSEVSTLNGTIKALHWEVIKKLKQKSIQKYVLGGARMSNIEGTRYKGIQQFKMGFGSQLTEGLIWKQDINKLKCSIYDMLFYLKYNLIKSNQ